MRGQAHYLTVRQARDFSAAVDAVLGTGADRQRRRRVIRALENSGYDWELLDPHCRMYAAHLQAEELAGRIKHFRPAASMAIEGHTPDFLVVAPRNEMELHFVEGVTGLPIEDSIRRIRRGWPFWRYILAVVDEQGVVTHRKL